MSYIINTVEGDTPNAWKYWVNNPPNGNILTLGATLNFDYDVGKIVLSSGTSFNGNGYSLNYTSIKATGMQIFDLQGGITSNISVGTSIGTKGILLINTINNNLNTIIDGTMQINGNLQVSNRLDANDFYPLSLTSNIITSNTITTGNIILNKNDLQKILNNKMDNSTINIMFSLK